MGKEASRRIFAFYWNGINKINGLLELCQQRNSWPTNGSRLVKFLTGGILWLCLPGSILVEVSSKGEELFAGVNI